MAGDVFPLNRPRPTDSNAERSVYDALKRQLPDGWMAWHSLRLRAKGGKWEGEGDFVVAVPRRGILVLEVKGGAIELKDGHWLQNGRVMPRAPRDQAQSFARNLANEVHRLAGERVPFGVGCVFPEVEFSAGPETGDLRNAVLGARHLQYLTEALGPLVDELLPKWNVPEDAKWRAALQRLWGATWVPKVQLKDRIEDALRQRFALDTEQLQMLDLAGDNPRALVEGAAGTGKTVVARELGLRKVADGQRVLYICYTEALAAVIDQHFRELGHPPEAIRAVAVRQYARELVGADEPPVSGSSLEFWETISKRALDHLPSADRLPDCVVVDEAQDLAAGDWMLVQALAGNRALWVFHDPRQSFWADRVLPDEIQQILPRLKLKKQQRSPPVIQELAERFAGGAGPATGPGAGPARTSGAGDSAAGGGVGAGLPVVLQLLETDESSVIDRLASTLDSLVREGVRPEQIAVLSLAGLNRSLLPGLDCIGSHAVVRSDAPTAHQSIVADTFLRFKGLERPFIVIAELGGGLGHRFDTRMHIALTRATVGVRILCSPSEAAADPRLSQLRVG